MAAQAKVVREKIKKGELKTKEREGRKSAVWNNFYEVVNPDDTSAGYVICKSCEGVYVHDSHKTGTSNMVHHKCAKAQTSTSLMTSFVRRDPNRVPQDVKSKLTDSCVDLCSLDMRLFDIVSGKGFHKVAQTLIDIGAKFGAVDAGAILPHRQTVCDRAKKQASIDKKTLSDAIQRALSSNGGIAVTTDMWTDEFKKRAYTVLTCHYISEWKLVNRILATVEFDPTLKKTSENLHEQITSVLMSYGIQTDKIVFVSDQGSNIKAALRSYHWIPCSAHIINTVLRHTFSTKGPDSDSIEDVVDLMDYCKELVAYLKRTGAIASLKHTVNQECDVRWNSKVTMLESIQRQYQDIRELLQNRDQEHRLDGIHQDQLTHLIDFLTIFKLAITELEGELYPTIHMVLLWFSKLKKHCEPKFGDPPYMKTLRSRASALLDDKMCPTATHKIATFLHPKFKSLKMLAEEDRREVLKQVRELLPEEDVRLSHDGEEINPVTEPMPATELGGESILCLGY